MSFRPPKVINPKTPVVKMSEENQNIQVFVRCRPLKTDEKKSHLELSTEKRTIRYSQHNKLYSFDNVFDAKAKQFDVYRSVVEPLVDQVTEGYNCTVFAYGQTGTGKTFTMVGNRSDLDVSWDEDPTSGMIPRAIDQLIDGLESQKTEYTIRVSFLELYNEDAYDLLSPLSDTNKLRIYNDAERKGSVIISGLVELVVNTKAEIFEILEKGSLKRQTAPTLMNACSSRSHSIFSITVHIKEVTLEGEEVVKMGKLNLVDLAGSENIGRSGAVEERFREASNINKSLLTLGRVITSLVEKSPHIPYRDSKLTRLLQDSLGGKTKTSIIATISPGTDDIEDTLSTLDYAQRAKKITNKPEVNLKMSKKTLISEYLVEIDRLRRDLEASRDKKGVFVDAKNFASMEATLKEQEQNLEIKEAQIDQLQKDVDKWTSLLSEVNANLSFKCKEFEDLQNHFHLLNEDLKATRHSLDITKEEVAEQKVLVESHQITEVKLTDQAQMIMQAADKCVDDNQGLFHKIDKIRSLEVKNSQLLQNFNDNFGSQFEQIQQMGVNVAETIKDGYESIEQSITDKQKAIEGKNVELHSSMQQIQGTMDSFSSELLDLFQQDMSVSKAADNVKNVLANFRAVLSTSIEASVASFVENEQKSATILDKLIADNLKNRNELEEKIMTEVSRLNETTKYMTSIVTSIKEDFMQNYEEICVQLKESREEIARLKELNGSFKLDEKLQQFFSQLTVEYNKKVNDINHAATNVDLRLEKQFVNNGNCTRGFTIKTDDLATFMETDKKKVNEFLYEIDQRKSTDCQNVNDKCKEVNAIQSKFEEQFQKSAQSLQTEIESTTIAVDEQLSRDVNQTMLKSLEIKSKHVADFKEKTNELLANNNAIVSKMNSLVTEKDDATLNQYKSMKSYCAVYHSSQVNEIKHCLEIAQNTVTGFKKYQNTGITPKKCTYSYPKELACTSPHERIIARFKANFRKEHVDSCSDFESISSNECLSPPVTDCDSLPSDGECIDENVQVKLEDKTFVAGKKLAKALSKLPKARKHLKERN